MRAPKLKPGANVDDVPTIASKAMKSKKKKMSKKKTDSLKDEIVRETKSSMTESGAKDVGSTVNIDPSQPMKAEKKKSKKIRLRKSKRPSHQANPELKTHEPSTKQNVKLYFKHGVPNARNERSLVKEVTELLKSVGVIRKKLRLFSGSTSGWLIVRTEKDATRCLELNGADLGGKPFLISKTRDSSESGIKKGLE